VLKSCSTHVHWTGTTFHVACRSILEMILIVRQSSLLTGFTSSASTHVHLERPRRVRSWSDIPRPFKLGLHVGVIVREKTIESLESLEASCRRHEDLLVLCARRQGLEYWWHGKSAHWHDQSDGW
jgi:hypothetical protein